MEDAHDCIDTHFDECNEKQQWNGEILRGNIEMLGHTIEQTCNMEFGETRLS